MYERGGIKWFLDEGRAYMIRALSRRPMARMCAVNMPALSPATAPGNWYAMPMNVTNLVCHEKTFVYWGGWCSQCNDEEISNTPDITCRRVKCASRHILDKQCVLSRISVACSSFVS